MATAELLNFGEVGGMMWREMSLETGVRSTVGEVNGENADKD